MSGKCSTDVCIRPVYALCYDCRRSFCREHIYEHVELIRLQLNPLVEQVNQLNIQFGSLNQQSLLVVPYQNLEIWRMKAHELIDAYYREKIQEYNAFMQRKLRELEVDLRQTQGNLFASLSKPEVTHEQVSQLTHSVNKIQRNFDKMINSGYQIHMNPMNIPEKLVNFDQLFNISNLPPIYRVIDRKEERYTSLATDGQYLLLYHEGTLLLVDQELSRPKQITWTYGSILDMCYAPTLKKYIIINENEVFLLNPGNMAINKVRSIQWQQWLSCTCSEKSLYLSTRVYGSALLEFSGSPPISFIRRWSSIDLCAEDEIIDGMVYNDNKLGIIVKNETNNNVRFDLRSVATHERLWSLELDIFYNHKRPYRFCSINHSEWLIADHSQSKLIQITSEGKIKAKISYELVPFHVCVFGNEMLAVSTKTVVHLYKM